jgi:hypothetical protein
VVQAVLVAAAVAEDFLLAALVAQEFFTFSTRMETL